MDNAFLLPAALFPAIPLMMISFGNRYMSMASLIRKIHDEVIAKKLTRKDKATNRYLKQIALLRKRLVLNRATSTLAAISFIANLVAMYFVYTNDIVLFASTFVASLIAFGVSLILYIVELQLSTTALDTHLQDLEDL
jgi:hypothetical protein|tara:strand:- start:213 stop:626 length:414 start_codon:yes stop_codon:yes gene_type:complete